MTVTQDRVGRRVVLAPQEGLVAGGAAEEFEQRVQALLRSGHRDLLVDLRHVPSIDSRGVRALVRAHTTAQRLGASFQLACPSPHIRSILQLAHLDDVFAMCETLEEARRRDLPWRAVGVTLGGAALCVGLVWLGIRDDLPATAIITNPFGIDAVDTPPGQAPFLEVAKLAAAALIGMLVTAIHAPSIADKPLGRSMRHAQILLCISGAMMMIIISGSLARAFGIAGAASIIRFRTPVEDPKDVTIIFLLMALGMACGLGAFAVAGLSTAFLCLFLVFLDRTTEQRPRAMHIEIEAEDRNFPTDHVHRVFAQNHVVFETLEVAQGKETVVTYRALVDPGLSFDDLSAQLVAGGGAGIRSVSWELPKKGF